MLLSEILCVALVPTFTFPKAKLFGFALKIELEATPVPENAIV